MTERVRVTTNNGLRLRDSPRDGAVLDIIPPRTELEVLGRETWLRVNYGGTVGFVLSDYVEPDDAMPAAGDAVIRIVDVDHPALKGQVLRADIDFRDKVIALAERAAARNMEILVTSSLREPYKPVSGTVVAPAQFSNHHVGHAFDMNILFAGTLYGSRQLSDLGSLPADLQSFLHLDVQQSQLTWGGTFNTPDVVHIDDRLNVTQQDIFQSKLLALWGQSAS
jgi:hypothetical protein